MENKIQLSDNSVIDYQGYHLKPYNLNNDVLNFSPGPTALPKKVMEELIFDLNNNWKLGVTPLEISHRSPEFLKIKNNCEKLLREILEIPNEFSLLWTHGGGQGQFSAIPLNLMKNNTNPYYIITGTWSKKSFLESLKFLKSKSLSTSEKETDINSINLNQILKEIPEDNDSYIYLCSNETVNGLEFREDGITIPSRKDTGNKLMVVDMSSDILSKKVNWENIDVAFACAPKNLGISGSTITIVRNNLLNDSHQRKLENSIPSLLDWKLINNSESFWNTLPVFNIYITEKILQHYKETGGINTIQENSRKKAELIYNIIDKSHGFYTALVEPSMQRSRMNIPFYVNNGCKKTMIFFLTEAYKNNIVGLRTKTPFNNSDKPEALRISLYNSITLEDTIILSNFMVSFKNRFIALGKNYCQY